MVNKDVYNGNDDKYS